MLVEQDNPPLLTNSHKCRCYSVLYMSCCRRTTAGVGHALSSTTSHGPFVSGEAKGKEDRSGSIFTELLKLLLCVVIAVWTKACSSSFKLVGYTVLDTAPLGNSVLTLPLTATVIHKGLLQDSRPARIFWFFTEGRLWLHSWSLS